MAILTHMFSGEKSLVEGWHARRCGNRRIRTLPPHRPAARSADLRSGGFLGDPPCWPGRRPALRGQCRAAPFSNPFGILCALLVLVAGWLAGTPAAIAEELRASEYQVKAAYLLNFAKYADWPAEAFAGTNSPMVVAVLGETKMTGEIEKVIAGRTVNGREIVLKHLSSGADAGNCHLLFVSAAELQRSPNLLAQLKDTGILTVGESDDFLERGGIINLARRDQKIALEVNLTAAGKARIKISSKLLGVAGVVKGRPK